MLDNSNNDECMDLARCSQIHVKVCANNKLDPNHYLVHWAQWLQDALKGKTWKKMVWVILHFDTWMPVDFELPVRNSFRKNHKDSLEEVQPISDTELLDNFSVDFASIQEISFGVKRQLQAVNMKSSLRSSM